MAWGSRGKAYAWGAVWATVVLAALLAVAYTLDQARREERHRARYEALLREVEAIRESLGVPRAGSHQRTRSGD